MMNLVKDNPLFNEMKTYNEWYAARVAALKEEKMAAVNKFGWGSEEVDAVREKLDSMKNDPYGDGAWYAWRAVYWNENEKNPEDLRLKDFCWDRVVPDFIETLRKFGITTFVTTDESTALMRNIHEFIENGCELVGIEKVAVKKFFHDEEEPFDYVPGLRFNIK